YLVGSFHAVIADERPKRRDHLWVYDMENETARQVTAEPFDDGDPDMSPDGRWLVFTSNRTGDDDENNNTDLFVVPADSGEVRRLTVEPGPVRSPAFSPDGQTVAYTGHKVFNSWAEETDLWVIPFSGGKPLNLTSNFNYSVNGSPVWSRDGKSLYFTAGIGTDQHLYRVPASGGRVETVLQADGLLAIMNCDNSGRLWSLTRTDPMQPADVYLWEEGAGELKRLTRMNERLSQFDLARTELLSWKGAGGFNVEGV
ncbi:unnamed protein product, partial [marine sediment metagenome]